MYKSLKNGELENTIIDFTGGITNDPRDEREGVCRMCTNFDIFTDTRRMIPHYDAESGDNASSTSQKQNFCIGYKTAGTDLWVAFAYGVVSGTAKAEVLFKLLTTGASQDLDDNDWSSSTLANYQSASGAARFELFMYYHKTGKVYGARANQYIWAFTPDGATAWDDTHYDYGSTFTNLSQGIVHSQDDIMYFGIDNKIIKNNNGTFGVAFTLPTYLYVTSVCEYGAYLAVAAAPLSGVGNSRVFLWDRNTSLTTVTANIDWGRGIIKVLEELDGVLIGITQLAGDASLLKHRVVFKYYTAGTATPVQFNEFYGSSSSTTVNLAKQKSNNRIYFMMDITINGTQRAGVWSIGKGKHGLAVSHESTPNNDTALSTGSLKSFLFIGDYLFIAYRDSGGTYQVTKTNDSQTYNVTSIYETVIYNAGDASLKKDLKGISVTTEPLPSAGQIVVKYKTDAQTSYTTILTQATDDAISDSAVNIESTGDALPKDYKEIQFRIEATGGAVPTSFSTREIVTGKRNYT